MMDNAIQRVICVAELVRLICAFCDLNTLARLVRVSQTFLEPGLDFLWAEAGLLQAFKCLPQDSWQVKTRKGDYDRDVDILSLKRWIKADEWSRFKHYSKRVKLLNLGDSWHRPQQLNPDTYQALLSSLEEEVLFPNLTKLTFRYDSKRLLLSHLRLFLSPRTAQLCLLLPSCRQSEAQVFFQSLHSRCPFIRELTIRGIHGISSDTSEALSESILHWTHLESITVPTLSLQAVWHLSSLPSLKDLDITAREGAHFTDIWPENSFPVLNSLTLSAPLSYCRKFLRAIKNSPLSILDLELEGKFSRLEWQELLTEFSSFGDSKLTSLYIRDSATRTSTDIIGPPFQITDLRPLFCMAQIDCLGFRLDSYFDLCDSDLKEIAGAWPKLHSFELVDTDTDPPERTLSKPRATIYGMGSFAKRCPNLYSLAFRFDATVLSDDDPLEMNNKPAGGKEHRSLGSIYVVDCPIASPVAVACYLSSLFPNLEYLNSLQSATKWTQAADMMPYFQAARRQEQNEFAEDSDVSEDESANDDGGNAVTT